MSGMGHITTLRAGPVSYRIHCPRGPLVLGLGDAGSLDIQYTAGQFFRAETRSLVTPAINWNCTCNQ